MFTTLLCLVFIAGDGLPSPVFSQQDWTILRSLSPAILLPDTTNAYEQNEDAANLGQTIFFDERFSSNKEVSCATCHEPDKYFTDGVQIAAGTGQTTRNSPTVLNSAHQRWFFWDGRADTLWGQPIQTMEHPAEMNFPRKKIISTIAQDPKLSASWNDTFGELDMKDVDGNAAKVAKALASYITKLDATDAPFDAFVAGDSNAISSSAQRGLQFFIRDGGCLRCHFGPWFSDGAFHSVGIGPLGGGALKDAGRASAIDKLKTAKFTAGSEHSDDPSGIRATISKHIAKRREDWGSFRTPSLRNVAKTAPYMHAGQIATLEAVVEHYSSLENFVSADHHRETILEPLNLTEQQKTDLIAFLESLTAPLPDAALLAPPIE
jgi:cytochrome c peroxidase